MQNLFLSETKPTLDYAYPYFEALARKRDPRKATETIPFKPTSAFDFVAEKETCAMLGDLLDDEDEKEDNFADGGNNDADDGNGACDDDGEEL